MTRWRRQKGRSQTARDDQVLEFFLKNNIVSAVPDAGRTKYALTMFGFKYLAKNPKQAVQAFLDRMNHERPDAAIAAAVTATVKSKRGDDNARTTTDAEHD